ncbi:universal stress protein [Muricauda sp. JGD-17]|uniref:Universal stress protein n=1 Tax=Flagellimonas ochracea TaxID=2696472 RepID=A0A964TE25_9FLAO|nr:universal stress protein [Allomuricauda ochracea]NAY92421.1 universal stress protein [Allomuricauda ochracea]
MMHVVVPTDFTNNAYNALFYAAHLFKEQQCTFHVVHIYNEEGNAAYNQSMEGLEAIVHRLIRDVGKNKNHELKKIALKAELIRGIVDYLSHNKADIMVIGNKGKDEVKDILFGNNAMQLVREVIQCPILVVPLEIDFKKVDKIAFISNYSQPISVDNVKALKWISSIAKAELVPMTIEDGTENKTILDRKEAFLEEFSLDVSKEVVLPVFKDKTKTILEFVDLWNIDMLCMVYYPHHFFLEFIGKGIIKELNIKLTVPFLILSNG